MARRAPPVDPFTRDAEGNRIFAPGTVTKRKHATLTDREREIYRASLLPLEEQQHARFRELHQESLENLQRREAMELALPIVETAKTAEESLQEELARKALQRKDRLNKAAVRRNWEAENGVQFTQLPHKRLQDDDNSEVTGIQPTQNLLEVRVQELEVQPAKRRRIQTDEARAKAIARQAEKKASERKAMSISLPEVPEWVGGLVEPEMERLLATSTHSSRILQSQAEAKAHKMGRSHPGVSDTPSELQSPTNEGFENEGSIVAENGQVWAFPSSDDLLAYNTGMKYDSLQVNNGQENTIETIGSEGVPADTRNCTAIQDEVESQPDFPQSPTGETVALKSTPSILLVHKLIIEVDGPLIQGSPRVLEHLTSRNRLETFRRRIFNLNRGDLSGEAWSGVFIAYLKPNTVGTFSYWNFVHTADDYIEYLHHIGRDGVQKEHHLVTGNRADAHLLPPPHPSRPPTALTNTNTEGDLSPADTASSAQKIDRRSAPAIPWYHTSCSEKDQQGSESSLIGGGGEDSFLSQVHPSSIGEAIELVDPGLRSDFSQPQPTLTTQSHVIRPMASKTYWGFERQFSMNVEGDSGYGCYAQTQSSYVFGELPNCHGVNYPPNPQHVGLSAVEFSTSVPTFEGQYRVVEPPFLSCLAEYDGVRTSDNQHFNSLGNLFPNDGEIGIDHPDFFNCVEDEGVSDTFHTPGFLDYLAQGEARSLPSEP
ncbi:uncharacterized protein H6S33_010829 [Morchella sextelata]|uniref:uncharacterized protein n=1 Tax=Morchella sextelata TaxID=1174677 RepID=UPI001D0484C1|nr:uncharacterized protein H6S33_010829 [Morchella sextelata]KAH0611564.1 hypothetical protein H6S33_010829 [Morchella sextelata]